MMNLRSYIFFILFSSYVHPAFGMKNKEVDPKASRHNPEHYLKIDSNALEAIHNADLNMQTIIDMMDALDIEDQIEAIDSEKMNLEHWEKDSLNQIFLDTSTAKEDILDSLIKRSARATSAKERKRKHLSPLEYNWGRGKITTKKKGKLLSRTSRYISKNAAWVESQHGIQNQHQ